MFYKNFKKVGRVMPREMNFLIYSLPEESLKVDVIVKYSFAMTLCVISKCTESHMI